MHQTDRPLLQNIFYIFLMIVIGIFTYYHEIRPVNIGKSCYSAGEAARNRALSADFNASQAGISYTPSDADKIKNEVYSDCMKNNGL